MRLKVACPLCYALKCIYRTCLRVQSRSEIWVGVSHRPQSSTGPYRRGCEAPGYRLEVGGDWACILLGLTSHCLLWSQQNGPPGPHFRRQAAGINPAAERGASVMAAGQWWRGKKGVTPMETEVGGVIYWIYELSGSLWLYIIEMQM